ncbi:MAG: AAA family ATPase [Candidatus Thermoplasmatota archaeon]|nr:AAA family ATPase [Candidatus Thermoplasmatota archaeon]
MSKGERHSVSIIEKVEIFGLFGLYDEIIEFQDDQNAVLLYGLNGSGKTTVLSIIKSLLSRDYISLMRLPFERVKLSTKRIIPREHTDYLYLYTDDVEEMLEIDGQVNNVFDPHEPILEWFEDEDARSYDIQINLPNFIEHEVYELIRRPNSKIDVGISDVHGNIEADTIVNTVGFVFEARREINRKIHTKSKELDQIFSDLMPLFQQQNDIWKLMGGSVSKSEYIRMLSEWDLTDDDWDDIASNYFNSNSYSISRESNQRYQIDKNKLYSTKIQIIDEEGETVSPIDFLNYHLPAELYANIQIKNAAFYNPEIQFENNENTLFPGFLKNNMNRYYHSHMLSDFFLVKDEHLRPQGSLYWSENHHAPNLYRDNVNMVFLPVSRILGDRYNSNSDLIEFAKQVEKRHFEAIDFLKEQVRNIKTMIEAEGLEAEDDIQFYQQPYSDDVRKWGFNTWNDISRDRENTHLWIELSLLELNQNEEKFAICIPDLQETIEELDGMLATSPEKNPKQVVLNQHNVSAESVLSAISDLSSFWIITKILSKHFDKTITLNKNGKVEVFNSMGKNIPLSLLSSGEKQLTLLYWKIFSSMKRNRDTHENIVIIDEPELSLHISWQRDFISNLLDLLVFQERYGDEAEGGYNVKIFVATHSPSILANNFDFAKELGAGE